MPAPYLQVANAPKQEKPQICLFGQTNYRNQVRRFGIKLDDRRRHMYIIGKTGMGKSTMMENMMLSDIYSGHGVGLVDPHGDFAEKIIDFVPSWRMNDVVYLNPADLEYPIGFNILEVKNEEQKHLVASGMMGTFKKIWPDVWSARMEYILNNTLLALLDNPGSTLLGINRMMSDKKYRKKMVAKVTDPVVKAFWQVEFASYSERYAQEATSSVQNKIGQFLSTALIRNMVAQPKSTIDVRRLMDEKKILIMNLSKGRMGEDNSRLMGGMLITKIQLSAMERVDTPEHDRKDFFLYVDEFQNFATPSFANILSEARKYRLSLVMAHQYIAQLDEVVADAVFGNVGTICTFRVGAADAEALAKEFAPTFIEEDIVNLNKFRILLKLMIDGVASQPFSAMTMPPIGSPTGSSEKVIRVSRERYGKRRADIEEKVMRWSGLVPQEGGSAEADDDEDGEKSSPDPKPEAPKKKKDGPKKDGFGPVQAQPKPPQQPKTKPQEDKAKPEAEVQRKPEPEAKPEAESKPTAETLPPAIPSISLASLLPEGLRDDGPPPPAPTVPKPEAPLPAVSLESLLPPGVESREETQPQKKDETPSQQPASSSTGEDPQAEGKKRKRKRKRKRKKKSGGEQSGEGSQPEPQQQPPQPTQQQSPQPQPQPQSPQQQKQESPAHSSPPGEPRTTVLPPNAVIRFDD